MEGNNTLVCVFGRIGDIPYTSGLAIAPSSPSAAASIFLFFLFGSFAPNVHRIFKGKKCTYN
jgi:hypothetical protein